MSNVSRVLIAKERKREREIYTYAFALALLNKTHTSKFGHSVKCKFNIAYTYNLATRPKIFLP